MTDRRSTQYAAGSLAASAFVAALRRAARRIRTLPDRPARLAKAFKSESRSRTTGVEVQVSDVAHLLGVISLVLGDVSDPDLIHLDQGVNRLSGPKCVRKLRVLSAWIPAVWSPLKRVVVLGQPAA